VSQFEILETALAGWASWWHAAPGCERSLGRRRFMSDTTYEVFQDGRAFKVRITRLGNFIQEADGFSSKADATSWIAQHQRLVVIDKRQEPTL
jgi:hypothetical protein